jgi:uncharacterized protein YjbI with pentapeptide repeats
MTEHKIVHWETCDEDACIGVRLASGMKCLAHADDQHRNAEFRQLREGSAIDLRGVQINSDLLRQILTFRDEEDRPLLKADFSRATFTEGTNFVWAAFTKWTNFIWVRFSGAVDFSRANFVEGANFGEATFATSPNFSGATFGGAVDFSGANFVEGANFGEATFAKSASFTGAKFGQAVDFSKATFSEEANFGGVAFAGGVNFSQGRFKSEALFEEVDISGSELNLSRASFAQRLTMVIKTKHLSCVGAQFSRGANLRARSICIQLDDTEFGAPSIIGMVVDKRRDEEKDKQPRVLSLRHANVANLVFADVDLRACRFIGAHNLDQVRLEGGDVSFALPPPHLQVGWAIPPVWWWTRRRTVAEEHIWRQQQRKRNGWYPQECKPSASDPLDMYPTDTIQPSDVAPIYRNLRKSYEDRKYEPGAADFYYGEMEMRRHTASRWSVERMLLTLYWLISGYALRAWRAFAALLTIIVIAAVLFAIVGFKPPAKTSFVPVDVTSTGALVYKKLSTSPSSRWQQLPTALGYSAEIATSLLRGPERPVTSVGEWTRAVLRWLGPLLFGLALFSLRGRVKR